MTQTALPDRARPAPAEGHPVAGGRDEADPRAVRTVCPYLTAADGGWRSGTPMREHLCAAVAPPAALALDKQRRLCLGPGHDDCATFIATRESRREAGAAAAEARVARPYPRTAPLVLDHGRRALSIPALAADRSPGQLALVGLMSVAFGAIVVARSAGGGEAAQLAIAASATPTPSVTARLTSRPAAAPIRTLVPTGVEPTRRPAATSSPAPSAPSGRTYTVKRGDTLYAIARRFGTTIKALAALNAIKDPTRVRIGTVLQLP